MTGQEWTSPQEPDARASVGMDNLSELGPDDLQALDRLSYEIFPAWWKTERLKVLVGEFLKMIVRSKEDPPTFNYANVEIPEAGTILVTFDGQGGLNIEPGTATNRAMRDFARALQVVLRDRLTMGPGPFEMPN